MTSHLKMRLSTNSKLKVRLSAVEDIKSALDNVQNKCSVNLVKPEHLEELQRFAEKRLHGMPKIRWTGVRVVYCAAGPDARRYRYPQGATFVEITYRSKQWYLTDCRRTEVWAKDPELCDLLVYPDQADTITQNFLRNNSIRVVKPA